MTATTPPEPNGQSYRRALLQDVRVGALTAVFFIVFILLLQFTFRTFGITSANVTRSVQMQAELDSIHADLDTLKLLLRTPLPTPP